MGFINDNDRRAHIEHLQSEAEEEARLTKEARPILIASFEKLAELVMQDARNTLRYDGVVHRARAGDHQSTTICEPHHLAALKIHESEPELLIGILNRAMNMTEGVDYTIVNDSDRSSSTNIRIAYECCGWNDGLKLGIAIDFSPPLR